MKSCVPALLLSLVLGLASALPPFEIRSGHGAQKSEAALDWIKHLQREKCEYTMTYNSSFISHKTSQNCRALWESGWSRLAVNRGSSRRWLTCVEWLGCQIVLRPRGSCKILVFVAHQGVCCPRDPFVSCVQDTCNRAACVTIPRDTGHFWTTGEIDWTTPSLMWSFTVRDFGWLKLCAHPAWVVCFQFCLCRSSGRFTINQTGLSEVISEHLSNFFFADPCSFAFFRHLRPTLSAFAGFCLWRSYVKVRMTEANQWLGWQQIQKFWVSNKITHLVRNRRATRAAESRLHRDKVPSCVHVSLNGINLSANNVLSRKQDFFSKRICTTDFRSAKKQNEDRKWFQDWSQGGILGPWFFLLRFCHMHLWKARGKFCAGRVRGRQAHAARIT